jgi:hypothetical protein
MEPININSGTRSVVLVPAEQDQPVKVLQIPNGYQSMNDAISAKWGDVVNIRKAPRSGTATMSASEIARQRHRLHLDLWIDDEGALANNPRSNARASALSGMLIFGDALVICCDIGTGGTTSMPSDVADELLLLFSQPEQPKNCIRVL